MGKFKIIEEGVLTHTEMGQIKGGAAECIRYSCYHHESYKNCLAKYVTCESYYSSCTGTDHASKLSCDKQYSGAPGSAGLTTLTVLSGYTKSTTYL